MRARQKHATCHYIFMVIYLNNTKKGKKKHKHQFGERGQKMSCNLGERDEFNNTKLHADTTHILRLLSETIISV